MGLIKKRWVYHYRLLFLQVPQSPRVEDFEHRHTSSFGSSIKFKGDSRENSELTLLQETNMERAVHQLDTTVLPFVCDNYKDTSTIPSILPRLQEVENSSHRSSYFRKSNNPLMCPVCGRTLLFRSEYEKHMRTHTGEKPYVCHLCSYRSAQRSNLNVHLKSIHKSYP